MIDKDISLFFFIFTPSYEEEVKNTGIQLKSDFYIHNS